MKAVFFIEKDKASKAEEITKEEPIVRQSITFRDNKSLGIEREGNYLMIDGTEEACEAAREKLADLSEELKGDEKDSVVGKMEEMQESALEGFGGIFG